MCFAPATVFDVKNECVLNEYELNRNSDQCRYICDKNFTGVRSEKCEPSDADSIMPFGAHK